MKVLEVNVDDHLYGGVYVLVKSIIQYLPKHIRADVAALEPFDDKNHITELNEYGSEVYYVGSKRNKVLKQIDIYRNIKQLIKEKQYDVVHLHSDVSHKILVSALAARKAPKLVFHAHANDAEGKFLILRRIFHKMCCVFLKRIPADYLATSADAGKWMFPWAKKEDVIVLNNGIDYHRFEFDIKKREEKRKELGYRDDEFVICISQKPDICHRNTASNIRKRSAYKNALYWRRTVKANLYSGIRKEEYGRKCSYFGEHRSHRRILSGDRCIDYAFKI